MGTVRQDVAFGPANLGLRGAELTRASSGRSSQVGMPEYADRPPHHLSFGQRRRVAVATVLAMEPEILVLDEPSSNLDPASRRELADILRSLDVTVLMVTHDLPYALELCPRSVVLTTARWSPTARRTTCSPTTELMGRHRLELPFGFDPASVRSRRPDLRPARGNLLPVRPARPTPQEPPTVSDQLSSLEARDRADPGAARRHHRPARPPGQPQDDRPS